MCYVELPGLITEIVNEMLSQIIEYYSRIWNLWWSALVQSGAGGDNQLENEVPTIWTVTEILQFCNFSKNEAFRCYSMEWQWILWY